jgi:hypothetical protein
MGCRKRVGAEGPVRPSVGTFARFTGSLCPHGRGRPGLGGFRAETEPAPPIEMVWQSNRPRMFYGAKDLLDPLHCARIGGGFHFAAMVGRGRHYTDCLCELVGRVPKRLVLRLVRSPGLG